ncbi:helix-turn-helix domain-containing protein [Desulfogranum mediterraneum]|uniref:helix-turn-helix domain-containing protein n=1 Tax=Desulfogranum mediterraneum TaxID=160661 RepID=UPI0003FBBD47|nr:AraC family transcriptional regulator [Desulfogranum mediterraneum]
MRTFSPGSPFSDYIHCYWLLSAAGVNHPEMVSPVSLDGGLALVFNLGDPVLCTVDDSRSVRMEGDFLVGSLGQHLQVTATGSLCLFGVSFTPEGLYPFFSMPPVDLSNLCVEMEEVWELNGLGLAKRIHAAAPGPAGLIQGFETFFVQRIAAFRAHSRHLERAVALIRASQGNILVGRVAECLQLSSRQLERTFTKRIGIPPKQLCRLIRIKQVLRRIQAGEKDLASMAVAAGFFDQAHCCHAFKASTGSSPGEFLGRAQGR